MTDRIEWIDLARAAAILLVLLCHSAHGIYQIASPDFMAALSPASRLIGVGLYTLGRIAVPIFLMISGYLLLSRTYDSGKTLRFWKRNCRHLFLCCILWCAVYEIFLACVQHEKIDFLSSLLFLRPLSLCNYWYIPMIMGLYVLIPFAANALRDYDTKIIARAVTFFVIIAFVAPTACELLKPFGTNLEMQISLGFSGGMFGIYMVIGYLTRRKWLEKVRPSYLAVVSLASLALTIAIQLIYIENGTVYTLWYDSVFLLICAVGIFELTSRISNIRFNGIIRFLSRYSFGVYLIHVLIRNPLMVHIQNLAVSNPAKVMVLWAITVASSYAVAVIISRIPKIGKYILYIR